MTLRGFLHGLVVFVAWETSDLYDWATRRSLDAKLAKLQAEQRGQPWNDYSDL